MTFQHFHSAGNVERTPIKCIHYFNRIPNSTNNTEWHWAANFNNNISVTEFTKNQFKRNFRSNRILFIYSYDGKLVYSKGKSANNSHKVDNVCIKVVAKNDTNTIISHIAFERVWMKTIVVWKLVVVVDRWRWFSHDYTIKCVDFKEESLQRCDIQSNDDIWDTNKLTKHNIVYCRHHRFQPLIIVCSVLFSQMKKHKSRSQL